MTIAPLLRQDLDSLSHLQPEGWPDILPFMDFYTQAAYCFPHKAVIDGRIAGIGAGVVHGQTGWLGHIIVSPDHRQRGIGQAITQALVHALQAQGCATLYLLATALGEPVYLKTGFQPETEYLFFKDMVPHAPQADACIVAFKAEHHAQIAALDRQASGEDRLMELERYLHGGYVYHQAGTVHGFYLPGLGDGLIIAATPGAGLALMTQRLATFTHAMFPADNTHATQYLYGRGYKELRRLKRMRLGPPRAWHPEFFYNRIAGNIG